MLLDKHRLLLRLYWAEDDVRETVEYLLSTQEEEIADLTREVNDYKHSLGDSEEELHKETQAVERLDEKVDSLEIKLSLARKIYSSMKKVIPRNKWNEKEWGKW